MQASSSEEEEDDEEEEDVSWVSWYCGLKGNEFFCEVEEDYINVRAGRVCVMDWGERGLVMERDGEITRSCLTRASSPFPSESTNLPPHQHNRTTST